MHHRCRRSSLVEHLPSKQTERVRFPSLAPLLKASQSLSKPPFSGTGVAESCENLCPEKVQGTSALSVYLADEPCSVQRNGVISPRGEMADAGDLKSPEVQLVSVRI